MTPTPRLRSWYSLIAVASALLSRVLLLTAASTSTVYYRRQQQDPIFSWDNRDNSQRRIDGSDQYARFVGLTLHRRGGHIYWSDSRAIQSAPIDGSSDTRIFLGGLARVTWVGANFASPALELTVKGTRCVSVASHASDRVECLVALPERVPSPPIPSRVNEDLPTIVRAEDCVISTANGAMAGVALNFREMVAEGYPTPIVERIEIEATYVLPHALAIDADTDKDKGQQWLYWSNSADGRIYRSSLTSTAIEVVQENRWSVRGLATIPSTVPHSTTVFISQEDKGTISRFDIQTDESSSPTEPAPINGLVRGLHNPRGLAVDAVAGVLFFTEKTGRIYQVQLAGGTIVSSLPGAFPDDAAIQSATGIATRRVVTLSTRTRLDGIAVDSKYIYWCETNTNVVARAPRGSFKRQILVGGTANSLLSWPRGVVLGSNDGDKNVANDNYYYSEYLGRISKGPAQNTIVNELRAPSFTQLDSLIREAAVQDNGHQHLYALE